MATKSPSPMPLQQWHSPACALIALRIPRLFAMDGVATSKMVNILPGPVTLQCTYG
jgi:hypothetical protein